ncbi:hypothetical protein DFJ73DRAFT_624472, partial [Zopfochytrium polystomum]
ILITGVAGFIGSHSAHRILQELPHATVVGIDNLSPFYDVSLKHERVASLLRSSPRFHFHRADIADPVAVPRILAAAAPSPTVVLHFAAQPNVRFCESHPAESYRANVTAYEAFLAHLTAAAGQLVHLVVASSSTVYGDVAAATQQPCNEASTPPRPASEYARQKLRVEQLSAAIATAIASKTVDAVAVSVLRFFSVYGPAGRPDMAPAAFAARVEAGAHVQVFGDALAHSRDFTFVEDAVDAVVRVVLAARPPSLSGSGSATLGPPPPLTVWNVGTGSARCSRGSRACSGGRRGCGGYLRRQRLAATCRGRGRTRARYGRSVRRWRRRLRPGWPVWRRALSRGGVGGRFSPWSSRRLQLLLVRRRMRGTRGRGRGCCVSGHWRRWRRRLGGRTRWWWSPTVRRTRPRRQSRRLGERCGRQFPGFPR